MAYINPRTKLPVATTTTKPPVYPQVTSTGFSGQAPQVQLVSKIGGGVNASGFGSHIGGGSGLMVSKIGGGVNASGPYPAYPGSTVEAVNITRPEGGLDSGGGSYGSAGTSGGANANSLLGNLVNEFQSAQDAANKANEQRYAQILSGYDELTKQSGNMYDNFAGNMTGLLSSQYGAAMQMLEGSGEQEARNIREEFASLNGQQMQELVNSGFYNTTIKPQIMSGMKRRELDALGGLAQRIMDKKIDIHMKLTSDQINVLTSIFGQKISNYVDLQTGKLRAMENRTDSGPDMGQFMSLVADLGRYAMESAGAGSAGGVGGTGGAGGGVQLSPAASAAQAARNQIAADNAVRNAYDVDLRRKRDDMAETIFRHWQETINNPKKIGGRAVQSVNQIKDPHEARKSAEAQAQAWYMAQVAGFVPPSFKVDATSGGTSNSFYNQRNDPYMDTAAQNQKVLEQQKREAAPSTPWWFDSSPYR